MIANATGRECTPVIVYLDTNCVVCLVESNPAWLPQVVARMGAARSAGDTFAVSDLTRAEALVVPYRKADAAAEAAFDAFFGLTDMTVFPVTRAVCERSARLRAAHRFLKLPDAMHLVAAIEHGCGLFLTADARLAAVTGIAVEAVR
ncbi:MAG: PIN domain-containing protein [Gemmataceae bacterium]|nr:PIN domain-containing protein [Gemmataceae bacterium]